MTKHEVSEVLQRVHTWPDERQEEAAQMLLEMEAHDANPYQLTDQQLAEVRRRRTQKTPKLVSFTDARKRFHGFGV